MASTSSHVENDCTPRRNPRRSCARKEPWKFDNEDENGENKETSDIDDYDDMDFQVYTSTPCSGQTSGGNTSNASAHVNYRSRNLKPSQKNKKMNKFVVDYDPDNDVFIHDGIKVNFNADTLKTHIKHFMKTSGVPAYKRSLSKCMKKIACTTPQRRPYKKRNPSVRKKREPREPEPDLSDESPEVVTTPSYPQKRTPESTLRAMIYTRDFLNRLAQKRKEAAAKQADRLSDERRKVIESEILKGVVAFVDVISHADEDISSVIKKELEKLGAVVVPTFTKNDPVSIILFNDGHVSTYKKAKKRGIPLVSVLWIEECRRIGAKAPADQFPAYKTERYESPAFVKELKKRKFLYASERMNPRKQRKRRGQAEKNASPEIPEHESPTSSEAASDHDLHGPAWLNEIEGSNGMMRILVNMTKVTEGQFREMMEEPEDSEKYEISPLPMRLLHKHARDLSAKKSSNADSELTTPCSKKLNVQSKIHSIGEKSSLEEDVTSVRDSDTSECTNENVDKITTKMNTTPIARRISSRVHKVRRILSY
ncbi:hypothetical protein R5R35_014571 [Gryllus longicercus]|uniref:BRCT domain-containing protein n=1 Tax=Gryllus longicercus TaxID=2509291 RepID=A0AAN9VDK2_9ORTH